MKQKLIALAAKHGCTIDVQPNGSVYLDAPEGKMFSSCQSRAVRLHSGACGPGRITADWAKCYQFAKAEIAEGFEEAEE